MKILLNTWKTGSFQKSIILFFQDKIDSPEYWIQIYIPRYVHKYINVCLYRYIHDIDTVSHFQDRIGRNNLFSERAS